MGIVSFDRFRIELEQTSLSLEVETSTAGGAFTGLAGMFCWEEGGKTTGGGGGGGTIGLLSLMQTLTFASETTSITSSSESSS